MNWDRLARKGMVGIRELAVEIYYEEHPEHEHEPISIDELKANGYWEKAVDIYDVMLSGECD
jgi:hypothetical protein